MAAVNDLVTVTEALGTERDDPVVVPPGGPTKYPRYYHEPSDGHTLRTDCGNNVRDGAELDPKHAEVLGFRPCPKCFPSAGDAS